MKERLLLDFLTIFCSSSELAALLCPCCLDTGSKETTRTHSKELIAFFPKSLSVG